MLFYSYPAASTVRKILKRGGGQKLQKIWEEHRSEFEIVTLRFRPIFRPKSGEDQKKEKKGLHSDFVPFFAQNHSNFQPKA